jgi:hypothetical protein
MKRKHLILLLASLLLLSFSGCKTVPASISNDSIVGTWKDSYGLTEYQFEQDSKMKIEALDLGSFKGNYKIDGDKITMEYRVVVKDVKETYTLKLDGNTMYLDGKTFSRKK